jgi:transposase
MMWGAISYTRKPQLVHISANLKAARYRDELLTPHMLPSMNLCRDNARPHTARSTVDFLANQNVTVLPWPSKTPDLNPIEHLWYDFERHMRSRQPVLQTLQIYNRLLSKNGENSARPYSSIDRVYIETGR